ncbi:MAG TPA: hypothetical protein VGO40_00050 [Longimicrobium sp.]|jgi:hypothetical protein|nr:hypothetical protein [Longimicrobium sp.]
MRTIPARFLVPRIGTMGIDRGGPSKSLAASGGFLQVVDDTVTAPQRERHGGVIG